MSRDLEFVCRQPGCGYATSGRKFAAQGLVAHYRGHGKIAEGTRQLNLQRRALAGEQPQIDETGEVLPLSLDQPEQRSSIVRTDLARMLEESEGKLTAEVQTAVETVKSAQLKLNSLSDELARVKRARLAYAAETALDADSGEYA